MRNRILLGTLIVVLIISGCESPTSENDSPVNNSIFLAIYNNEFTTFNVSANVSMGDTDTSDYVGAFAVYTEDFSNYENGLTLNLMVPNSSGTLVDPGLNWLIIKIQRESMTPGVYTLDSSDQNLQLSAPGQVKLYYNDSEGVIHCGSGELIINELLWSNSGEDTAELTIDIEFSNITLDGGNSSLGINRSLGDAGSTTGSLTAAASKMDISNLVGSKWKGSYSYYGVNVSEILHFISETTCILEVFADNRSTSDTLSYTYSCISNVGSGTLKGDQGDLSFTVKGNELESNNVVYKRQPKT